MLNRDYVCVIGGTNIDICGTPFRCLSGHDSAPGKVSFTLGGVGRNVSENLARLGVDVIFVTVIGNDFNSQRVVKHCEEMGIDLSYAIRIDGDTSCYLYLTDERGEMQYAVADMASISHLTKDYLVGISDVLNRARACVIDTNLDVDTLDYLMQSVKSPLFMDPVSTQKAEKLKGILKNLHTFKPNKIEAETICGFALEGVEDLQRAAAYFRGLNIDNVLITLEADGIYYNDGSMEGIIPSYADKIVNTTGAGDALLSALVWAYLQHYDIENAAKVGMKAAAINISDTETVSSALSKEAIDV